MTLKLLSIAAFSLMLAGGAAMAQTDSNSNTDDAAAAGQDPGVNLLSNPEKMGPFFTDDTMVTMRSSDEMKTAWMAMSEEDRTKMKTECETTESIKYKEFCGAVGEF